MDIRDRILAAASHVYSQHGFRGATTRLIALEAGVNEVTLFRIFGSKAALFETLMETYVAQSPVPPLPDAAEDPETDVSGWAAAVLGHMRQNRALLRTSVGEMDERPNAAVCMCEGPNIAAMLLIDYVLRLQATGRADADADIQTAVAMLMSSLFSDAMCRDIIPNVFPQPADDAPDRYVRTFLRSVGVATDSAAARLRLVSRKPVAQSSTVHSHAI